jgi:D-3-phosphoglycerate dehydrogenase / 2-oxoglutarate reductase
MKKLLISAPYMIAERARVEPLLKRPGLEVEWASVRERLEESDLLPIIGKFDAVICGDDRFTPRVLDAATKLKAIVKWGTGIDSIDKTYATQKGIKVLNTPNAFTNPVADTTLGYILHFARGNSVNDQVLRSGGWHKPQGFALSERTVGIIGFGNIGRAVAKRLRACEATVLANDIVEIPENVVRELGVTMAPLTELLERSDFVTLHCDLNSTSRHILNRDAFSRMKRKPYVVNTARGPLIEEGALIEALEKGIVAGAGLDVFEDEPLPRDHVMRRMPNTILACHNSNSSPSHWWRIHERSARLVAEELGLV